MPDANGWLQSEGGGDVVVGITIDHLHHADGCIVLIHFRGLIDRVGRMGISEVECQPLIRKVVTQVSCDFRYQEWVACLISVAIVILGAAS